MMLNHWTVAEALASEHRRALEGDAARRRLARRVRRRRPDDACAPEREPHT